MSALVKVLITSSVRAEPVEAPSTAMECTRKFLLTIVAAIITLASTSAFAQIAQTINWTTIATPVIYSQGLTIALSATGGASGNSVIFSSQSPGVCSVTGNVVSVLQGSSYCHLSADQAGNASYAAAATVYQQIYVDPGSQSISFPTLASPLTYASGLTFTLSATGGASGNPVVFGTQSPTICSVAGNVVSVLAGGNCAVSAAQAGNLNYTAAMTLVQYVFVNQGSQVITFPAPSTPITYAPSQTFTVAATGGASGNPVVFSSSTNPVCTVSAGVVSIVKAGTCTIVASQAGNAQYNAATAVGQTVVINKANQTISFDPLPSRPLGSGTFTLTATATSGLTVTFTSRTTPKCTVAGSTVTLVATGTCTLRAAQAGNVNYNAATVVDQSFTITAGGLTGQVISNFNPATPIAYQPAPGNTFTLTATGGGSGNPVIFASTTASVCTVSAATATIFTAGTCTLTANQAGNASYSAASQVTANVIINKASQTISFATLADKQEGDAPFTVSASATSTLAVTFSSTTPTVCTVAGNTVTLLAPGTCSVKADQAGNGNYLAAVAVTRSFTVNAVAKVYYVHADQVGSPRAITRPSDNAVVWTWDNSDPFGANLPNENPSGLGNFKYNGRFEGQYYDEETGTHYNRFRDYVPGEGRYAQSDPIGLSAGINTYVYVGGSPLTATDPFGLANSGWQPSPGIGKVPLPPDPLPILRDTLNEMLKKDVRGTDQFFHCLATCRAKKAGSRPEDILFFTDRKENWDYLKNMVGGYGDKKLSSEEMSKDNAADRAVNRYGLACPPEMDCNTYCSKFLDGLAEKRRPFMKDYRTKW